MAGRITRRTIDALKPGQIVWDGELRGFGARRVKGAPVYVVKYRAGHGRGARQRWVSIGAHGEALTPEKARAEAKRILGRAADGKDPATVRDAEKAALSVRELAEKFLSEHVEAKRKASTARDYRRLLEQFAIPAFGSQRADAVTRSDVARLHQSMSSTPRQANFMLSVLSKMFNWGEARGYRPENSNPCRLIERYRENRRERFLSEAELAALGAALNKADRDGESPFVTGAIRLLIFTGTRLSEILTMRWEHVDARHNCVRLPDSKTGAKVIYLNPPALEVLTSLPRMKGNPHVICGALPGAHLVNLEKPWRRLRAAAGIDDVRLHDLRHSFASMAAAGGHSLQMIGRLLGHTQTQTTARYAHLAADPVKSAAESIANRIHAAMAGTSAKVVELRGTPRRGRDRI